MKSLRRSTRKAASGSARRLATFGLAFVGVSIAPAACNDISGPVTPGVPTGVSVVMLTPSSARVSWSPNPEADAVSSYKVFRNGTQIGESAATTFVDSSLVELTTYRYAVAAVGASGSTSAPSADSPGATVTAPDVTAPRVSSSDPAAGATSVPSAAVVSVTFSEPMDPSSISAATFTLRPTAGGASIAGAVTYAAATRIAEFRPASALPSGTDITATVSTGAKDAAGNALPAPMVWAFTIRDEIAPTVSTVSPANASTGVALSATVTATFSEAMDASSINSSTFSLKATSSGASVTATVAYNAATRIAVLTPAALLTEATGYTVTVATGVKDAAGNALSAAFVSTFTTAAAVDDVAPLVILVSPADGATGIPIGTSVTVTFNEPMDGSTLSLASFSVTPSAGGSPVGGTLSYNSGSRAATFAPSTPFAAGTTYTVRITTGARDIAGNSLASAFASSFTTAAPVDNTAPTVVATNPSSGAIGVPIGASVSVRFSEPMDAATISPASVTLSGPGGTVDGSVTCDASCSVATFTPSAPLSGNTSYSINVATTATDAAGNALASQFASGFATVATDVVAPVVTAVDPVNGATGVAVNTILTATFSKAMDPATINASTFLLRNTATGGAVDGIVTWNAGTNTAGFNVVSPLANGTGYTATITTGARDASGNGIAANVSFAFTTVPIGDTTPPVVSAVSPSDGATNIATGTAITISFSEPMNAATINASTVTLSSAGGPVTGSVSYDAGANSATFAPAAALAQNTAYSITVTTGAKDAAGNALAAAFSSSFTTVAPAENSAPTVVSTSPGNGATGVSTGTIVTVSFSEPMDGATINTSTVTLGSSGGGVAGSVSYDAGSHTATFTPLAPLAQNTGYTITVTTGAKDAAGKGLASDFTSGFTTVAPAADNIAPTVVSNTPVDREKSAPSANGVTIVFSEPMSSSSITSGTIRLMGATGDIAGPVNYDAGSNSAIIPSSTLLPNSCYRVIVTTGVKDVAGNALASEVAFGFTTAANGSPPTGSACGHWGGSSASTSAAYIHLHMFLTQTGSAISERFNCAGATTVPECRMYAYNQAAADAMGLSSGDPNATKNLEITDITGSFTEPNTVSLTLTLENGRIFNFTGSFGVGGPTVVKTLEGSITGVTLAAPVPIKLDWYPNIQ